MKIAIFSDLHIPNFGHHERAERFARVLRRLREEEHIAKLWLLGDIFDLLVGNFDFWRKLHAPIFQELKALQNSGCEILWLEGNHDFHFLEIGNLVGAEVRDGPQIIEIPEYHKRVYLAHGDLVNTNDRAYMRWRAVTRNPIFRKTISLIPELIAEERIRPVGEKISSTSRKYSKSEVANESAVADLYRNFAKNRLLEGFDGVFLGHCHIEELFDLQGKFYLNLGSWLGASYPYGLWDLSTDKLPRKLLA